MRHIKEFKCPVCHRLHAINPQAEGLDEVCCTDNETSKLKLIKGRENKNLLTNSAWNFNRADTKVSDFTNNLQLQNVRINRPHPKKLINW